MFNTFIDVVVVLLYSHPQVHRATLHDGRQVAVKVQYPGVADSIDSDLKNLQRIVSALHATPDEHCSL